MAPACLEPLRAVRNKRNMTRKLYLDALPLWLVVSALPLCQVRGTCLGDNCDVEHAQAKSSGLLGSSNIVCPDKSYPAKDPLQPVGHLCSPHPAAVAFQSFNFKLSRLLQLKVSSPLVDFRWIGPEHQGDKVGELSAA